MLNYEQLSALYQPPYGDRAICLKDTGEVVGAVGLVPCLKAFGQFSHWANTTPPGETTAEVGLFWHVMPEHQNKGYATEAARVLMAWEFDNLLLARIVATTDNDNNASQAVMRKLGMSLERNALLSPPWLQTVGVLTRAQFEAQAR